MNYLFDTNILISLVKKNHVADAVADLLALTNDNRIFISTVTIGEVLSIARRNQWGSTKVDGLTRLYKSFVHLAVEGDVLYALYATLDAFSQNKLPGQPLEGAARNMGKNDLWIAASASIAAATLITTDKDFDHLHERFLDVIWLDPRKFS